MRNLNLYSVIFIAISGISVCGNTLAKDSQDKVDTISPAQEQIVRMLEEDLNFESQRKQLSNELALEKLRLELNKLKAEGQPVVTFSPSQSDKKTEEYSSVKTGTPPVIVLVSEVAGLSRILVKDGESVKLRKPSESFTASNGNEYRLVSKGDQKFTLKEVQ
ncbi:TPA: lngG [Salmonella enterica]|nr:lngG [Salmonella enterica]HBK1093735.1 lngG [Salmonella enterica]